MTQREAFEAWAIRNTSIPSAHEMAWSAWQAATMAERERCAGICEGLAEVCEASANGAKKTAGMNMAMSCAMVIRMK